MADQEKRFAHFRPISPLHLPKLKARAALVQRLISVYDLDKPYAEAIARIVVDPATVRNQLSHPFIQKLPDGYAQYIMADVWSPGVAVSLINPRENEQRTYPIAAKGSKSGKVLAPLTVESNEDEVPVLKILGESREHVTEVAADLRSRLRANSNLRESIAAQGVLEPLTVVLASIRHTEGKNPEIIVPMSIDGSTRVTLCHELTNTSSEKIIYREWNTVSERDWRGRLGGIIAVQNKAAGEASDEELASHRAVAVPARILVGLKSVRGGNPCRVHAACRYIVSRIHLDPPKEWPAGSQNDEIADTVLDRLVEVCRIKALERQYLAGLILPTQLKTKGFSPHLDVRAARIVHTIFDANNNQYVREAYLSLVDDRQRIGSKAKPEIAAEMIMRSFRGTKDAGTHIAIAAMRSVLQRVLELTEFKNNRWSIQDLEPHDLLAKALTEQSKNSADLGPARLSLAVMASYWLVSTKAMERDTRTSQDMRSPSSLIRAMLTTPFGIRVLHRAIIDGRANQPLQQINESGVTVKTEAGEPRLIDDNWLRSSFSANGSEDDLASAEEAKPPRDLLHDNFHNLRKDVDTISNRIVFIKELKDRGVCLIQQEGMPPPAEELSELLGKAAREIGIWAMKYDQNNADFDQDTEREAQNDADGISTGGRI